MKEIFQFRISYFLTCAQSRTFGEAADAIGITQPALSLAIKQLEDELGKNLLHRDRHGIRLSSFGEIFYKNVSRLKESASKELFLGEERRCFRIGSPPYFIHHFLLPAISKNPPKVFEEHPVQIFTQRSLQILQAIEDDKLDFGFVAWTRKPKELPSKLVFKEKVAIAGLKKNFSEIEKAKSIDELKHLPWVYYPKPQRDWTETLTRGKAAYVATDSASLKSLILEGYAIGEIELEDFSESERAKLSLCSFPSLHPDVGIYAIWKRLDDESREFLEKVVQNIQKAHK